MACQFKCPKEQKSAWLPPGLVFWRNRLTYLVGGNILLDLGDHDTALLSGVDRDTGGVGKTRELVGVLVHEVSLLGQNCCPFIASPIVCPFQSVSPCKHSIPMCTSSAIPLRPCFSHPESSGPTPPYPLRESKSQSQFLFQIGSINSPSHGRKRAHSCS